MMLGQTLFKVGHGTHCRDLCSRVLLWEREIEHSKWESLPRSRVRSVDRNH